MALRGAAERAAALGSHQQAIAFLEHALAVSPEAADRADLHERALASAMELLSGEVAERHGLGALEARRELGDRVGIALATAAYALAIAFFGTEGEPLLKILRPGLGGVLRPRGDPGRRRADAAAGDRVQLHP